uniref:Uncharacterized protein LOC114337366 n=1 Tax=Diabrotica virgifera virgifera TaxID=50390 RepID=A0A6P7GIH6_DIAVI
MADDENKNIQLVLEVEKRPCLYNTTLSNYSPRTDTDKAWAEIGRIMEMTGAACKEKWRNLRVVFMRHLKPLPSGSGRKKKKPYYLFDYMQFLTPYVRPIKLPEAGTLPSTSTEDTETHATIDVSNDVPEDLAESEQSKEPTSPGMHNSTIIQHSSNSKRKKFSFQETDKCFLNYLKDKSTKSSTETSTDSVMSFLNSLAPELREMNMHQFKIFKRRTLSLIDDILNPPSSSPESETMSAVTTLSNETSRDTICSPRPYGSPS